MGTGSNGAPAKQKNKGGRPRKGKEPRTHQSFGLAPLEKIRLALEATHYGITVTDLMRYRVGLPVDLAAGVIMGPPGKIYAQESLALGEGETAEPVLTFQTRPSVAKNRSKARIWHLMPAHLGDLQITFPRFDILAMCRIARGWINADPSKRQKTADGMAAFLLTWIRDERDPVLRRPTELHQPVTLPVDHAKQEAQRAHTAAMFQLVDKHRKQLRADDWPTETLENEAMKRAEAEDVKT